MANLEQTASKTQYPEGGSDDPAQEKGTSYDIRLIEVADKETEHQARIGAERVLTPEEKKKENRLLRKIDLHIMPLLMITYGLQYSDKITLSSAVAFDLQEDAGLVGDDYAWLSTGFYLAFLAAEFPFGWLMQKFPMEKILAWTVIGWSVCIFGLAACDNFEQLMAVRTILGILEAPITPGFLILVTAWYIREEQVLRSFGFFSMNSFFSLFILMINYEIGATAAKHGGIKPWKAIHLWLGSLTFVWGCVLLWRLCIPKNARWLTEEEKVHAHARLVRNQAGDSTSGIKFKWAQVRECFGDLQVWFILTFTIIHTSASGGFSTFSTIILQSFGLNTMQTISYQLPWYGCQLVGIICVAWIVNKWPHKNLNLIISFVLLIPALTGILLEALLSNEHRWGRLIGFWITGFYTPSAFCIWSTTGLNVAGRTKKSVAQAAVFVAWCAGFAVGPQAFSHKFAPEYRPGLIYCCVALATTKVIIAVWFFWVRWENKRRDKAAEAMGLTKEQQRFEGCLFGLQDMTDKQNPHFRYRY